MAARKTVVVTRKLTAAVEARLRRDYDAHLNATDEILPPERIVALAKGTKADALLVAATDNVGPSVISALPDSVKAIATFSVGYNHIDVEGCKRRGIVVTYTPDVLTDATADLTMLLVLGAARRAAEGERLLRNGEWTGWAPTQLLGTHVTGKALGILGMGRIGRAFAKRARGFDMRVLYYNRQRHPEYEQDTGAQYVSLETLLAQSDYVSVNCPLNDSTRYIINANTLKLMKRTAILVNTSRGGTVEPQALYEALKHGTIAYAALDVTEPEPIGADYPLLSLPNCLILPHLGSSTIETRLKMATMAARNLMAGVKGERLPNCVNPEVYG